MAKLQSAVIIFCCAISTVQAAEHTENTRWTFQDPVHYIKDSSYVAFDGNQEFIRGHDSRSQSATFYTFDGQELAAQYHHQKFKQMYGLLDKQAPKPQPTRYILKHWQPPRIGNDIYMGVPGMFILFFDKHGNQIAHERYSGDVPAKEKELDIYNQNLDLTLLQPKKVAQQLKNKELGYGAFVYATIKSFFDSSE